MRSEAPSAAAPERVLLVTAESVCGHRAELLQRRLWGAV
jgi:hypothetical protein